MTKSLAGTIPDPVIVAIAVCRAATNEYLAACDWFTEYLEARYSSSAAPDPEIETAAELRIYETHATMISARKTFAETAPTTAEGIAAFMRNTRVYVDGKQVPSLSAEWFEYVSAQ